MPSAVARPLERSIAKKLRSGAAAAQASITSPRPGPISTSTEWRLPNTANQISRTIAKLGNALRSRERWLYIRERKENPGAVRTSRRHPDTLHTHLHRPRRVV